MTIASDSAPLYNNNRFLAKPGLAESSSPPWGVAPRSSGYPTAKARDEESKEDFAESVTAALWDGYVVNVEWTDDSSDRPDELRSLDRYDQIVQLFR